MSLASAAAKGGTINVAIALVSQATTLVVFLVLARLISPAEIGVVTLANAVLSILWLFVDQGFGVAITRAETLHPKAASTAFWIVIGCGAIVVLGVFTAAPLIASFYDAPELTGLLRALALLLGLGSTSTIPSALLTRNLRFRTLAYIQMASNLLGAAGGTFMAAQGFGAWSLVGKQAVEIVAVLIGLWKTVDWRPTIEFDRSQARTLFRFGTKVTGNSVLQQATRRLDEFLVGHFAGNASLGLFSVGLRAGHMLHEVSTVALNRTALPILAKMQGDKERLKVAYEKSITMGSLMLTPLYAGLGVCATNIVELFFGNQWLGSVPIMQAFAISGILQTSVLFLNPILLAMGEPGWPVRLAAGRFVLVGLTTTVGVQYGIVGVAVLMALRNLIMLVPNMALMAWLLRISPKVLFRSVSLPWIAALAMALAIHAVSPFLSNLQVAVRLFLQVCLGATVYLVVLFVFARQTLLLMWDFFRSIFRKT